MKLIIQIPCLNEAETLPATVRDLPRSIPGVDVIEYLVIDDGSDDATVEVARSIGVHHILSLGSNRGLARAFSAGIEYALEQGADIVVNTDADNQYRGSDIGKLVRPILENRAEVVVGCRPIIDHPEFGALKKGLQLLGSWTLRQLSKTRVRDAASGFRAYSRNACLRTFIYSRFSYTMESLIQAGTSGLRVRSVDIQVNPKTRDSRLFSSIAQYVRKSGGTMIAMFVLYRPGVFFSSLATLFLVAALGLGARYLSLVTFSPGVEAPGSHLASLVLLAICALVGFLLVMVAILAELIRFQRRITEENLFQLRIQKYAGVGRGVRRAA